MNRKLNLVLEIERDGGAKLFVHSTPISREVFEANFIAIGAAISILYREGLHPTLCTGMTYLAFKKLMTEKPEQYGALDQMLLQEIWRLTNVAVPTPKGWETVPFGEAMQAPGKYLDEEEIAEIMNFLCYFTAASWVHGQKELRGVYEVLKTLGAQTSSLDYTAFLSSLTTSKAAENTGETAKPSPIPS
jgi:hypothetical protein